LLLNALTGRGKGGRRCDAAGKTIEPLKGKWRGGDVTYVSENGEDDSIISRISEGSVRAEGKGRT